MKHAKLCSEQLQFEKEGTFDSPGLPSGGSLISASAVPHHACQVETRRANNLLTGQLLNGELAHIKRMCQKHNLFLDGLSHSPINRTGRIDKLNQKIG